MDQELIEYLDRQFNQLRTGLRQELGDEVRQELGSLGEELRRDITSSAAGLRREIATTAADLRTDIAASAVETRRHFDVVAEQLMDKIQLVGEGVIGLDQKVDRLATETRTEFQKVDRRFLHLEARVIAPRD